MPDSLDDIVAKAGLPELLDRGGVAKLVGRIEGATPSVHTLRRWPIPYRQVGRAAVYKTADVIAFVRSRFNEAPIRRAPTRRPNAEGPRRTVL